MNARIVKSQYLPMLLVWDKQNNVDRSKVMEITLTKECSPSSYLDKQNKDLNMKDQKTSLLIKENNFFQFDF